MQPFHFEDWYNTAPIFEKCHYGQFIFCTVYKYPFSQQCHPINKQIFSNPCSMSS